MSPDVLLSFAWPMRTPDVSPLAAPLIVILPLSVLI
jgi:hypothetical protein